MYSQQVITVLVATAVQFIVGAIWYTPLFGKLWGKIHGFDSLSKKKQQEMMSQMGPIFGVQALVTAVTSIILVILHTMIPQYSIYALTFWIWLGFVVPAQTSGVLFGGTEYKWMLSKIAVLGGGSLVGLLSGAAVVAMMLT